MDADKTSGQYNTVSQERRRNFTDDELAQLKEQLLESIYADIGKSLVKKILWVIGAILAAALAWLTGAGHIKLG
jgi:hypothetical protein